MIIEPAEIDALTRSLADETEGNFSQPADFIQDVWNLLGRRNENCVRTAFQELLGGGQFFYFLREPALGNRWDDHGRVEWPVFCQRFEVLIEHDSPPFNKILRTPLWTA